MATNIDRAWRVWNRMAEMYGARFGTQYGDEPSKSWIDAVELLTDAQIAFGLKYVRLQSPDHPPTLGRFQRSCLETPDSALQPRDTTQERLTRYALSRGWIPDAKNPPTFVYKHWTDSERPKNLQNCAECIGMVFDHEDGSRHGYSTEQMLTSTDAALLEMQ